MRILPDPNLPIPPNEIYDKTLSFRLVQAFRAIATQLNNISEGRLVAVTNSATAAPTTGTWARGDFVKNSEPSEIGSAGSKYIIDGWECIVSGTPGTWVECRYLTGN